MLMRLFFAATTATLALGGVFSAAPVGAEPRCLFQGDWNCEGPPQYNGPLQNTWDVPGTYGGWAQLPPLCPGRASLSPGQKILPEPGSESVPPGRTCRSVRPSFARLLPDERQPGTRTSAQQAGAAPTRQAGTGTPTDHGFVDRDEHDRGSDSDEKWNPGDSTICIVISKLAGDR